MRRLLTISLITMFRSAVSAQDPTPPPEVRQIVTLHLQPGGLTQALILYERLVPIYQDLASLMRFRLYREVESPEPLDLVAVSSYVGMAGMDRANDELRRPHKTGQSAALLYLQLGRLSMSHHDQFVEMSAALSDQAVDQASSEGLAVFEYLRLVPAGHEAFEQMLSQRIRPHEKEGNLYQWSETGRMLVSDGWDYLRIFGVRSLGEWQEYLDGMRHAEFRTDLAPLVLSRKTVIVRLEPKLSVR